MLDIRGASRRLAPRLAPAHTRASVVILSYGGLYHQFSRPGSGAASTIGSQDIFARLYGTTRSLRSFCQLASLYRARPMSHNTTITLNNLTRCQRWNPPSSLAPLVPFILAFVANYPPFFDTRNPCWQLEKYRAAI